MLCLMGLLLVVVQVVTSVYQFQIGESGLLAWSPTYKNAIGDRFRATFFRPFGTSNVAGGGTTLIFLLTPLGLGFFLKKTPRLTFLWGGLLLAGVGYVLFISQVRAALTKCLFGCAIMFLILFWKNVRATGATFILLLAISFLAFNFVKFDDSRFESSEKRLMALSEFSTVLAHRNPDAMSSTLRIVSDAPLGIGLSRVGASAEPFKDLIAADTKFGPSWTFADNLYKALLVEIGIPGLIAFMSFLTLIVFKGSKGLLLKNRDSTQVVFFQAAAIGAVLASIAGHIGSEGFLYQPEATVVWILLGTLVKIPEIMPLDS